MAEKIGIGGFQPYVAALTLGLWALTWASGSGAQTGARAAQANARELEVRQYGILADDARRVAESKRIAAEGLAAKARAIDSQTADLEKNRSAGAAQLDSKKAARTRLQAENPQRDAENVAFTAEIARLQSSIAANLNALGPLSGSLSALDAQLAREGAQQAALAQSLDRVDADLERARRGTADRESELARGNLDLRQALDRRNDERQNAARAGSEMNGLVFEIAQRQIELRQYQAQTSELRRRADVAEAARRQHDRQTAPVRQRAADARKELDAANTLLKPLQTQAAKLTADLAQADKRITTLKAQLAEIDREITANKAREKELREALPVLEKDLQGSVTRRQPLDQKLIDTRNDSATLGARKTPLEAKIKSDAAELARLTSGADPAQAARIAELTAGIADLKGQLAKVNLELERRQAELTAVQREMTLLDTELLNTRRKISDATSTAERLRTATVAREAERARVAPPLDQAIAARVGPQAELDRLQPQLIAARQRVQAAEARLAPIDQELGRANATLTQLERDQTLATQNLDANLRQCRALETRVTDLSLRYGQLQSYSVQVFGNIDALDRQIPGLQNWVAGAETQLTGLRSQLNSIAQSRAAAANAAARQTALVDALQGQHADLGGRVNALEGQNRELANRIAQDREQISSNTDAVRRNVATLQTLQVEITQLESNLKQFAQQLPPLQTASSAAWAAARPVEADAALAHKAATDAEAKYTTARDAYDARRLEARQNGAGQGSPLGNQLGRTQGTADGLNAGNTDGTAAGREEGLASGLARGKTAGASHGAEEGYRHGLEMKDSYGYGLQEGLAQGERDAWYEARRLDNPRGHAAQRAELLGAPLPPVPVPSTVPTASPEKSSESPAPVRTVLAVPEPVMAASAAVRHAPPLPIAAPNATGNPRCDFGDDGSNAACREGFNMAWQESYRTGYAAAFEAAHSQGFTGARQKAFDESLNVRYTEGYDASYPAAYEAADRQGAEAARQKGIADGRRQGFERVIAEARIAEFDKGRAEETAFFAQNPVMRLIGAAFAETAPAGEAGDLVPGDMLALELTLANFGAAPAAAGAVKAQWKALTPNIAMPEELIDLEPIPGGAKSAVIRVSRARIATNAAVGSEARAQVLVIFPDGQTQESIVSAVVAADLPMTIERLEAETQPKVGKSYGVTVKFKNSGVQDTFNDVRVMLTAAEPSRVRIDKAETTVKKLKVNQSGSAELKFTPLPTAGAAKNVVLYVTVFHGRNVSARATLTVVPVP